MGTALCSYALWYEPLDLLKTIIYSIFTLDLDENVKRRRIQPLDSGEIFYVEIV